MNNNNDDQNIYTEFRTSSSPKKPPIQRKKFKNVLILAAIALFLIIAVSSSYYTIDEKQQGVVTTFGKVTAITDAGIHFKIPFGIQDVTRVDTNIYQKIEIGYKTLSDGSVISVPEESKMITGDLNIVNIDFFVEYKILEPIQYLYASEDPVGILKNITQGQIRNTISSYLVDDVLTVGKNEIQIKVKEAIMEELEIYKIGLTLIDVKIQDAEPPTDDVIVAFKSVETAKQDKETAINEARAYENSELPKAKAHEDQLIKNAEYLKQSRINDAVKQVAMFEAMFKQYEINPSITRDRMYYEYIEQMLPGAKVFINTQSGGNTDTSLLIPLDDFYSNNSENSNSNP